MPSKMFCCLERTDFRLLLKRMMLLRVLSLSSPRFSNILESRKRSRLYLSVVFRLSRYCLMPPTLRSMDISLSLRMMSRSLGVVEALLSPSNASPPLMEPSPMMATM